MWWIILLSVIGYMIMAIITGVLFLYNSSDEDNSMFGLLWPITLPIILVEIISNKIYTKLSKKHIIKFLK